MMTFICICLFILTAPFWLGLFDAVLKFVYKTIKLGLEVVCAYGTKNGEAYGPITGTKLKEGIKVIVLYVLLMIVPIFMLLEVINR